MTGSPGFDGLAMRDEELVITTRKDGKLRVTINRPKKRNALSRKTLSVLRRTFEDAASDDEIRLAVLSGAGDRCFAAGGDLDDLASIHVEEDAARMSTETREVLEAIRKFPVPVIAALNGDALGGGAELAVACDIRVAAGHAKIGFVQGTLAITTAWGGGADLISLVGPSRALMLLSRSEVLSATDALNAGIIDFVTAPDQLLADAIEEICSPMMAQARHVLVAFKQLTRAYRNGADRNKLNALETRNFARAWVHDDHWRAVESLQQRIKR